MKLLSYHNEIMVRGVFGCSTQWKLEMTSYLNSGCDVMNCFAKFEKLLPHSISMPSFVTFEGQMPELDQGGFFAPHTL